MVRTFLNIEFMNLVCQAEATLCKLNTQMCVIGLIFVCRIDDFNPGSPEPISLTRSTEGVTRDPRHVSSSMAHRNEITTVTPIFSRSRNPTVLLPMSSRANGSRKSKMAAVKTEAAINVERL